MKKLLYLLSIVLLWFMMTYSSCLNNDDPEPGPGPDPDVPELSEEEKQVVRETYMNVANIVDELLLTDDPLAAFSSNLASVQSIDNVEDAFIEGEAMVVKFAKAGKIIWYASNDYIIPPYGGKGFEEFDDILERIPVGDSTALLLNQQAGDEGRPYCGQVINHVKAKFEKNNYTVTVKSGSAVDINLISSGFTGYGAYFFISHGVYAGGRTYIMTGQEPDENSILHLLLTDLFSDWYKDRIIIGGCKEKRGGQMKSVKFYCFSDKLISSIYPANSFPNSLIYLVACQGMKNTNLAQAYNNAGAGVVIGWDETNCLGQSSGKLLFNLMLGGMTVEKALAAMPAESKNDKCAVTAGANLIFYPSSGKDIVLVKDKEADIIINTPVNGETYAERVQTLDGYMSNVKLINSGVVELNGVPTTLTVVGDTNFSQPLLINNGNNTVKVTCEGTNIYDETVTKTKEITVIGELAPIDIFTELRWNTPAADVDFHLLKPGAGIGQLWTSDDCYYSNMNTTWGAFLDVDDVEGYGPEHITVPSATIEGDYTLCIHYYDDDGDGSTSGFVSVSVNNGEMQSFGPYSMSNSGADGSGDVWVVCTINFPSGDITPVNAYHNLGKSSRTIPAKR